MSEDELREKLGERALSRQILASEDSDVSGRQVFKAHGLEHHSTIGWME
jgi:hypothetical protein